jgi:hypothetical protein
MGRWTDERAEEQILTQRSVALLSCDVQPGLPSVRHAISCQISSRYARSFRNS